MEVGVSELTILNNKIWLNLILTSEVVFMTTLMACVYEKVIYVDFDQLETDGIKNIESLWWLVRSTQSS